MIACAAISSGTKARLEAVETVADQDGLLPLLNRRAFVREMSRMISFAERYDVPASLIYFDLDGFKAVNDAHGHAAGDAALTYIADLLRANVRESDIVGRLGGDEFGVILAKADQAQAESKARSLSDLFQRKPFVWQDHRWRSRSPTASTRSRKTTTPTPPWPAPTKRCAPPTRRK